MTVWTDFVKSFAARNNLSYGCALSTPECKAEYAKAHPKPPTKKALKADLAKRLSKPHFEGLEEMEKARAAAEKPSAVKSAVANIEKNVAFFEAKLKEAQDWKKTNPTAPAGKMKTADENIRKATEAIEKLKAREKPAAVKPAKKSKSKEPNDETDAIWRPEIKEKLWKDLEKRHFPEGDFYVNGPSLVGDGGEGILERRPGLGWWQRGSINPNGKVRISKTSQGGSRFPTAWRFFDKSGAEITDTAVTGKGLAPVDTLVPEAGGITMAVEELKSKRGRPKKYATPEEAKVAKTVASVASNKRQKAIKLEGAGVSAKNLSHGVTGEGLVVTPQGDKIYPLTIGQIVKMLNTRHP